MRVAILFSLIIAAVAPHAFAQATFRSGEVLEMRISGVPADDAAQFSAPYTVDESGMINVPYLGATKAAGLLANQLQANIENRLKSEGIYTHPTILIQRQAGAVFVNIAGAVRAPGRIVYTPDLTLMSAVSAAGGPNDFASKTVFLTRQGKRAQYDMKKLSKDPSQDVKVLPGDQIEVKQSMW